MNKLDRRNMIFFGLGTVGRDMFYALEANALIYYLSNAAGRVCCHQYGIYRAACF